MDSDYGVEGTGFTGRDWHRCRNLRDNGSVKRTSRVMSRPVAHLWLLLLLATVAGCGGPRVDHEWRRPTERTIGAMLVVVQAATLPARRYFETAFAGQLGALGIDAHPVFRHPEMSGLSSDAAVERLAEQPPAGIEAILRVRVLDVDRRERVVSAYHPYADPFYPYRPGSGAWGGFGPAYSVVDTTVALELAILSAPGGAPLWTATIRSRNPESSDRVVEDAIAVMTRVPGPGELFADAAAGSADPAVE